MDGLGTLNAGGNNASSTFFGGMSGNGILTLTGSNTCSGGTTISAGTLAETNAASLDAAGNAQAVPEPLTSALIAAGILLAAC